VVVWQRNLGQTVYKINQQFEKGIFIDSRVKHLGAASAFAGMMDKVFGWLVCS